MFTQAHLLLTSGSALETALDNELLYIAFSHIGNLSKSDLGFGHTREQWTPSICEGSERAIGEPMVCAWISPEGMRVYARTLPRRADVAKHEIELLITITWPLIFIFHFLFSSSVSAYPSSSACLCTLLCLVPLYPPSHSLVSPFSFSVSFSLHTLSIFYSNVLNPTLHFLSLSPFFLPRPHYLFFFPSLTFSPRYILFKVFLKFY